MDRNCVRTVKDQVEEDRVRVKMSERVRKASFQKEALFPMVEDCFKAHMPNIPSSLVWGRCISVHFIVECFNSG